MSHLGFAKKPDFSDWKNSAILCLQNHRYLGRVQERLGLRSDNLKGFSR